MKFVKSINLQTEGQARKYQKGQTAKDKFNNLYVLQGIGKDGSNVWLLVRVYQQLTNSYRFNDNANDLRRAKRSLRKVFAPRPDSKFNWGKSSKGTFYNNFQQSQGYGRIRH
jgi:hypothetical protein